MEQRELGRTGLRVTPIGLGLAALGRPAYITPAGTSDLGEDAADRGDGGAQPRGAGRGVGGRDPVSRRRPLVWLCGAVPRVVAPRPRVDPAAVTVGSKWGYRYVGEWRMDAPVHEVKDHSLAMLRAQLPESPVLLGPWLRLYQVHSATLESGILADAAVLAELARLRAEDGLVIGLSVSGPRPGATCPRRARGPGRRHQPVRLRPGDVERAEDSTGHIKISPILHKTRGQHKVWDANPHNRTHRSSDTTDSLSSAPLWLDYLSRFS